MVFEDYHRMRNYAARTVARNLATSALSRLFLLHSDRTDASTCGRRTGNAGAAVSVGDRDRSRSPPAIAQKPCDAERRVVL